MNKFRHYQETDDEEEETDNADSMGDDNLYDDFEKYNDSRKKKRGYLFFLNVNFKYI